MTIKSRNANNRRRGKEYERRIARVVGGVRNLDKSRPHTDVETDTTVYEVKSTQSPVPLWIDNAMKQCVLASEESNKKNDLKEGIAEILNHINEDIANSDIEETK